MFNSNLIHFLKWSHILIRTRFFFKHESPLPVFEEYRLFLAGYLKRLIVDGYLIILDGIKIASTGRKLAVRLQDFALSINLSYLFFLAEKYAIGGELAMDRTLTYKNTEVSYPFDSLRNYPFMG